MIINLYFESKNHPGGIDTLKIVIVRGFPIHFHHDFKICDFNYIPQIQSLFLSSVIKIKNNHYS